MRLAARAAALTLIATLALGAPAQSSDTGPAPESSQPVALRLQDFFHMPVGAKGLVISERLRQAQGRQVRITG